MDKRIIYIMTGEVKVGNKDMVLKSGAIGSCLVITSYDKLNRIGAMAHIMLPEKAPENTGLKKTRYAINAIDELLQILAKNGADKNNLESCLAGGANILQRNDDNIGKHNIFSVEEIIKSLQLHVTARSLGGIKRRCISLDVESGLLKCSIGDDSEKPLWKFIE